jgi:hypothetical protein
MGATFYSWKATESEQIWESPHGTSFSSNTTILDFQPIVGSPRVKRYLLSLITIPNIKVAIHRFTVLLRASIRSIYWGRKYIIIVDLHIVHVVINLLGRDREIGWIPRHQIIMNKLSRGKIKRATKRCMSAFPRRFIVFGCFLGVVHLTRFSKRDRIARRVLPRGGGINRVSFDESSTPVGNIITSKVMLRIIRSTDIRTSSWGNGS